MPSSSLSLRLRLFVRTVVAVTVLAVVALALIGFEAGVATTITYGTLSVLVGAGTALSVPEPIALGGALVVYLAVAAAVIGHARLSRRSEITDGRGWIYLRVTVVVGSVMFLVLLAGWREALRLPAGDPVVTGLWLLASLSVVVVSGTLYALKRVEDDLSGESDEEDDDEDPFGEDYGDVWYEVGDPVSAAGARWNEGVVVCREVRSMAAEVRTRLGIAGTRVVVALSLAAFAGLVAMAHGRPVGTLLLPASAVVGALVALIHAVHAVGETRAEGGMVDGISEDLGSEVDDERTRAIEARLARLAAAMDAPVPDVRLCESRTATAAVVGYRPSASTLVVTTGLLDSLADRELDAVLAHELAHVANRDAAVVTALSAPRSAAGTTFYRYGANPVAALLAAVVAATSRLCIAVVSRAREHAADDAAVEATGDPAALAVALERLDDRYERPSEDLRGVAAPFSIVPPPWEEHRFFDRTRRLLFRRLLGTHPPTERRIERLRARVGDD